MAISHKYRTFDSLMEDVSIDFSTYALEGMIDAAQLIKVATRVNYDLGIRIHRTKQVVLEVEHNKARLPHDFAYLNYAFICGEYTVETQMPSGTHIEDVHVDYVPDPGFTDSCSDAECNDVCVIKNCPDGEEYKLIHKVAPSQYRSYTAFAPLRIATVNDSTCDCPNINVSSDNVGEIKDGFLKTNFKTGKVYINYQGAMEDNDGNLLVLDHPYCNEYYEYALKQRILENMIFAGEPVGNQMGLIEQRLRAARNNALSFVNTPDFAELKKMWLVNRKAQYHNYYNMFKSGPTLR
jgi:hypothetical protein